MMGTPAKLVVMGIHSSPGPARQPHNVEPHYDRHVWIYRDNPNESIAGSAVA